MKTAATFAFALALFGMAAAAPAHAAPAPSVEAWLPPQLNEATTFRADEAGQDLRHYPACVGQMNGTAHHSCGSQTGGPAGGLL